MGKHECKNIRIVSTGSCGTGYLTIYLEECYGKFPLNIIKSHYCNGKYFNIDKDVKFLYIYRHPIDSVVSFFNKRKNMKHPGLFANRHCKHLKGDSSKINKNWTVREYFANTNKDTFNFIKHYEFFMNNREKKYKFIYVKYEHFHKHTDEILHFLNVDSKFINNFKWKQGPSSFSSLFPLELKMAKKIYKDVLKKYNSYPEFYTNI